jgi:hypothetical protein
MALRVTSAIERLPEPLRRFMDRMTQEQKLLLVLKRDLYGGDWQAMVGDLKNRLEGRPFIVRLAARIEDDLARIVQMSELERHYQVDLADFVQALEDTESGA